MENLSQEIELTQEDLNSLAIVFSSHRQAVSVNRENTIASLNLEEKIFNFIFQEQKKKESKATMKKEN